MLGNILAVAIGGAIGSVGRYLCVMLIGNRMGSDFPWGTLTVNSIGGLAIGMLAGLFGAHQALPPELRLFAITGLLGGFTTFSAFSIETIVLIENDGWTAAMSYVAASVVVSIIATFAGLRLVQVALP